MNFGAGLGGSRLSRGGGQGLAAVPSFAPCCPLVPSPRGTVLAAGLRQRRGCAGVPRSLRGRGLWEEVWGCPGVSRRGWGSRRPCPREPRRWRCHGERCGAGRARAAALPLEPRVRQGRERCGDPPGKVCAFLCPLCAPLGVSLTAGTAHKHRPRRR